MAFDSPEYWPFEVIPPEERTESHWQQVRFLEEAFASGFKPFKYMDGEYVAEAENGRSGWICYRGHHRGPTTTRWEVALSDGKTRAHAFWTEGFAPAAAAVLAWLRGGTAADVLAAVEGHVIRGQVVIEPVAAGEQATS
jgi:hypothetical protein